MMLNFPETTDQENEMLCAVGMNVYETSSCMKNIHLEIVKKIFKVEKPSN